MFQIKCVAESNEANHKDDDDGAKGHEKIRHTPFSPLVFVLTQLLYNTY
jgi:hypothetical protein